MNSKSICLRPALIVLAALLLPSFGRATTPIPNEYWVSTSTNTANLGTITDPYDASTQPLFDKLMLKMPPNCTIHLLSGTYETLGTWQARSGGWPQVKSGQRIVGSGIDHTIIHITTPGFGGQWFGTPGLPGTNIEVCDMTFDGFGTTNKDGILLHGDHISIRRVKVVNLTSRKAEIFPIYIMGGRGVYPGKSGPSGGNVIEDCEVNLPHITWLSGIFLVGDATNYCTGAVRNNRVVLGAYKYGLQLMAIHVENAHDVQVEGNYVEGGNVGVYAEDSMENLMIHHNVFRNVGEGVNLFINASTNVTCSFNTVELAASPKDVHAFAFTPPYPFRNIAIIGNTIGFAGAPAARSSYALYTTTCTGVSFFNNIMDSRLAVMTDGSKNINISNNLDLSGNALSITHK